jgi:predicted HTH transcriptional regulator
VGDRSKSVHVDVEYEIPKQTVTEAIVNAVCHRDYTSNGSVQVMLFADRFEVSNPGNFPHELTIEQVYTTHRSMPANPLLAEAMYLFGTIERMGTGTEEMTKQCLAKGLGKPEFISSYGFQTIIKRQYRQTTDNYPTTTRQVNSQINNEIDIFAERLPDKYPTSTRQVETEVEPKEEIKRVIKVLTKELSRSEIQNLLGLKNRENFVLNYINPAIEENYIEPVYPDSPNHPQQKYRLTAKGIELKMQLV